MRSTPGAPHDDDQDRSYLRSELLRGAADGELSGDQAKALDAHLRAAPDDRQVIAFEHRLRAEIAAVATDTIRTPDTLRRRIESMTAPSHATPDATPHKLRRFTLRPAWALLAASIALVAATYLVTSSANPRLPAAGEIVNASHRVVLDRFLRWQHTECEINADAVRTRFQMSPADAAPSNLARIIQHEPDLGTLLSGTSADSPVEFLGAARCAVPGRGESVHLVLGYRDGGTASTRQLASLFIQVDHNELALAPGRTYHMRPRPGEWDGRDMSVCVWRKDGLVYFLVATSSNALDAARVTLGADAASAEL